MSCDNCNDKISTCSKKMNSRCIEYEGKHSDCSDLNCCDKPSVHETIEDISDQLSRLCNATDTSDFGELCLEYEGTGEEGAILLKDVVKKLEEDFCTLKESIPEEGACNPVYNQDISCVGLDLNCLVDACGVQPSTLKELLQLIINETCK